MDEHCTKLKASLEEAFCMPFTVDTSVVDGERHYVCAPSNEGETLFCVEIYVHNNIRLIADIRPQKHGGYLLQAMAGADEAKRTLFAQLKERLCGMDARVTCCVNGQSLDEEHWPTVWKSFACQMVLLPIPDTAAAGCLGLIAEWAQHAMELVFALLPITDALPDTLDGAPGEGEAREVMSTRYERNPLNRKLCLALKGYNCAVCGMNFFTAYGDIGYHFIEVHHTTPVSAMGEGYRLDIICDLVPVCPNCHAMLHRKTPPLTVDQLKALLRG